MEQSDEYASHTTLDLLLTMLHTNRQTCQIRAEVPSAILAPVIGDGTGGRGKGCSTCIIEGVIQRGRVVSISIRDQRGAVLAQGETAVRWSQYCGKRFWEVRPLHALHQEASFAQPSVNERHGGSAEGKSALRAWSEQSLPRRTHRLTPEEIGALPRKQRQVLLLIDGQRRSDELCRLLHYQPDQLAGIFDELLAKHLILFSHDDPSSPWGLSLERNEKEASS